MRLENREEPLASRHAFRLRYVRYMLVAAVIFGGSIAFGMVGFRTLAGMSWLDAFVNAVMMLTTMGPTQPFTTVPGKLFAAFFAMYSTLVFLATAGILIAPPLHRALHRFHFTLDDT